ncbi:hypothetical protein [Laspinema palackyanum]|uniref:hypothetical protein n=1 Tax=Laspinema palackyanum TaxID=3231601 RepID=UPI00345CDCE6|nr:hypothetical protein [Laspinema sp. D2c]
MTGIPHPICLSEGIPRQHSLGLGCDRPPWGLSSQQRSPCENRDPQEDGIDPLSLLGSDDPGQTLEG